MKPNPAQRPMRSLSYRPRRHHPYRAIPGTRRARALRSLPATLQWRAEHQADRHAFTFLAGRRLAPSHLDYGTLDRRARAIAAALAERCRPGDRILVLAPPGLEYIAAFMGTQYAGMVAVPVPAGRDRVVLPRLRSIVADAGVEQVLTTAATRSTAAALAELAPETRGLHWLAVDTLDLALAADWRRFEVGPENLSFLQYTSGSTGTPRGVQITHGNLLANVAALREIFPVDPERDVGVSWLPLFHDMGLIGKVLQYVFDGMPQILLSPTTFLKRPISWLETISRHRGTISAAPNFAFDLCVDRITDEQREGLDLSSWRLAICGAEPIRAESLERFAETYGPYRFRRRAFHPCYGLAEATLIVSGRGDVEAPHFSAPALAAGRIEPIGTATAGAPAGQRIVSCGKPLAGQVTVIVDPESRRRCAAEEIGEIWVSGANVATGYWRDPTATAASFGVRPADEDDDGRRYLRTGDLGFLRNGELYVTGRLKDLIIVAGTNYYPQDLEYSAQQSHPAFRTGGAAAFAIEDSDGEAVVLALEIEHRARAAPDELISAVRRRLLADYGVAVAAVALLAPGAVPKTSSGKLRRRAARRAWLAGELKEWRG
ncbi:MAG: fatty acyl-AMP ligase [bacterium]|nr:fatty acyl-AMP ligase [bacterium]